MIRVSRSIVPNFFTVGNMFCGFMAILIGTLNGDLILASWMIIFAAFLDALDGKVARFTKSSSAFGVEYDSLADVISFALAPSVLLYTFHFSEWRHVGIFISFFPLLFGSLRLARFNVRLSGFDKTFYQGLPSPGAAIAIVGYILFMDEFFPGQVFPKLLLGLTLSVCVLMISTVRYEVLPRLSFRGGRLNQILLFLLIFSVITLFIWPKKLFFPYILLYILSGLVGMIFRKSSPADSVEDKEKE